jgi:23S rRNA pseudouridine1911/1915/1917 synthase
MKSLDPTLILFEDNHLFVYHKPAGLPVQADSSGDVSLMDLAKAYLKEVYDKPGNVYLGLSHRIDRPVSGVVVMAKTSKAHKRLAKAFRERTVQKFYLAVTKGMWSGPTTGILSDHLWKDRSRNTVKVFDRPVPGSKPAKTMYSVLSNQLDHTVVLLKPITGRSHQLRVQLSHTGNSIIGDLKYGGPPHKNPRSILLHHYQISLPHPIGGAIAVFSTGPFAYPEWSQYKVSKSDIEAAIENLLK